MPMPCLGNQMCLDRCGTLATYLNGGGHKLKLFANNFLPTPASPIASFVEATFQGYLGVDLTNQFGAAAKVQDGQYQTSTPFFTFNCTGGAGQQIFGWWVDDGANMKLAQSFDAPITITPGSPYQLQIQPQEISQSIL